MFRAAFTFPFKAPVFIRFIAPCTLFSVLIAPAIAEKAGVKPKTIQDLRAGRLPKTAAKDERAVYDFIQELYKKKRVSDRNYKRVHALLGDAGIVEFVGIVGYYAMVAMTLNVFVMMPPADQKLGFTEPK